MAREREQSSAKGGAKRLERLESVDSLEELALRYLELAIAPEEPKYGDGPVLRLEELIADESGSIVFEASGVSTIYLETSSPVPAPQVEEARADPQACGAQSCVVLGPSTVLYFPPELEVRIVTSSE